MEVIRHFSFGRLHLLHRSRQVGFRLSGSNPGSEKFMKEPGIVICKPTILEGVLFAFELLIAIAMLYGVRAAIEDGEITNSPEVLRNIMFYMFSAAVCFRLCKITGLARNSWSNRFVMFGLFYIPIGTALAILAGIH